MESLRQIRLTLRYYGLPLLALLVMALALGVDRAFNRPLGGGQPALSPLIVMDDFHDLEMGLVVLKSYGPSRYSGRFTDVQWGGQTVCRLRISGYAVVALLVSTLVLSAWAAYKPLMMYENRKG